MYTEILTDIHTHRCVNSLWKSNVLPEDLQVQDIVNIMFPRAHFGGDDTDSKDEDTNFTQTLPLQDSGMIHTPTRNDIGQGTSTRLTWMSTTNLKITLILYFQMTL